MSNNQEIGAPSKGFTITINLLDLDIETIKALKTYAHELCFTLEEAIVNLIKSGLRDVYCNVLS
jgi:hypothetical protein